MQIIIIEQRYINFRTENINKFASMKFVASIVLISLVTSVRLMGQVDDKLIQFSGVVVTNDSLQPIPFSSVMIKHANRGTVTDYYGFFSFVAMKGDTVE